MKRWKFLLAAVLLTGCLSAQTPAPKEPSQKDVRYRFGLVVTRAVANFHSADSIEAGLAAQGSTLNPQIATLKLRIQAALDESHKALDGGQVAAADEALTRAESMLDRFAAKIGGY